MVKRCLIVSYYFPPVGGGGVQRMVKLINYLSRFNWQFTVFTAKNDVISLPHDESFLSEIDKSVKIIRIPITNNNVKTKYYLSFFKSGRSGYLQRWLSAFIYIPDIRKKWLIILRPALLAELNTNKYDCVLITSPPYSLAILASELTTGLSLPVILDMRDPWTGNPYKIQPTLFHKWKDRKMEIESITKIRYGISAYKRLIRFYEKQIKDFDTGRWTYIPNGYDENDFKNLTSETFNNGKLNIAFSGTFYSHVNNPEPLFKAMASLDERYKNKVLFHHLGSSQIKLNKLISKYRIENSIKQWGYLPHRVCIETLNKMDAFCFILDDRNNNSVNTVGGKAYEYLRFKKPILAMVPEAGEAAELIKKADAGEIVSPHNTEQIMQILKNWMDGDINYRFKNIETFSREEQARQFLNVLNRACETSVTQ